MCTEIKTMSAVAISVAGDLDFYFSISGGSDSSFAIATDSKDSLHNCSSIESLRRMRAAVLEERRLSIRTVHCVP